MSTEAQINASKRYNQRNVKFIAVGLNKRYDADIIRWLERQPDGTSATVKRLIRQEIEAGR